MFKMCRLKGCSNKFYRYLSGNTSDVCWKIISLAVLLQIIANCGLGEGAIRNVNLIVEPPAVRKGQHATLRCLYDLQGSPLYSVKFYRGLREFYRYSPSEIPNNKVFAFPGINVDMTLSNASQVVIRSVGFGLSGNFSCEVTADAPYFSTAMAHVHMQVVEPPEKRPSLWTDHDRYEPGDVLRANCSSPPSRPRAELTLTLNNIVIYSGETQYITTMDQLIASRTSLRLHLQSAHFAGGMNGNGGGGGGGGGGGQMINSISPGAHSGLILRCTAQISNLYQEYTEIELGVPQRDPIPARVTSSHASRTVDAGILRRVFHLSQHRTSSISTSTTILNTLLAANMCLACIAFFHRIQLNCR